MKEEKKKIIIGRGDPNVSSGAIFNLKSGVVDTEKKGIKKKISNKKRRKEDKAEGGNY